MPNPVALSIQVLGPFVVTRDGMPVPAHELASRKGRTLLKLLLARRGRVVPAEALAEALWGDRPPADPDANLATLVSRRGPCSGRTRSPAAATAGGSWPVRG